MDNNNIGGMNPQQFSQNTPQTSQPHMGVSGIELQKMQQEAEQRRREQSRRNADFFGRLCIPTIIYCEHKHGQRTHTTAHGIHQKLGRGHARHPRNHPEPARRPEPRSGGAAHHRLPCGAVAPARHGGRKKSSCPRPCAGTPRTPQRPGGWKGQTKPNRAPCPGRAISSPP